MRLKLLTVLLLSLASCVKLNDIAFYNEELTAYQLDDYTTDLDFILDNSYDVENIHELSLSSQSVSISAIYIGSLDSINLDTIILYSHGQSKHIDHYWQRAKLLANCGGKERFGVLIYDYQGFGKSEGEPSEQGMNNDIRAAMDWLLDNGASPQNIISYGFSLGSAPATDICAFGNNGNFPSKLILESPFASTDFLAHESTLIQVSASYITELEFDNTEKIKNVNQPLMWMHGVDDDYVAISNGEAIIENYVGEELDIYRVEGAEHGKNGVPQTMGFSYYLERVEEFITQ
ncbi:MAG: alpha/beta hydrolase [Flavobacteriales bacterium]